MDEYETEEEMLYTPARKHDRWSVLVLLCNYTTQILVETTKLADQFTQMVAQHREHKIEENKFYEVVK